MNGKKTGILVLLVLAAVVNVQFAGAGSIFSKIDSNSKDMYGDDKAGKVGDILTIVISENTEIERKLKRKLEKARRSTFIDNLPADSMCEMSDLV